MFTYTLIFDVRFNLSLLLRDAPLYLEWAPGNILSQGTVENSSTNIVGEHDAKRFLLEQQVEGITDGDIDPDRVEVLYHPHSSTFFLKIFSYIFNICYLSNFNDDLSLLVFYDSKTNERISMSKTISSSSN